MPVPWISTRWCGTGVGHSRRMLGLPLSMLLLVIITAAARAQVPPEPPACELLYI